MTIRRVDARYSLERPLGHGGSGTVWLGRDAVLERDVALKQIGMPPGATDPDALRAEREARLAAQVNHPDVVAVYDLVEAAGDHWLVMEYVDGGTLAELVRNDGPLTPLAATPLLLHVAEALAAAHGAGVVHRDVKPSNVLLDRFGAAKLSDFGIARGIGDGSLTATGLVTGSPAYLAPEVASGSSATAASDVWSFGALMYHVLAGHPPYEVHDNLMGALYKIVNEEPPRLRGTNWLGPLLEATMTKDPDHRPSMTDVADYLRARSDGLPSTPPPDTTPAPPAPTASTPLPIAGVPTRSAPSHTAVFAPAPGTTAGPNTSRIAVIAVAALALIAIVGAALLLGGGAPEQPAARGNDATDSPTAASSGATEPTTKAPPTALTRAELKEFARTYLRTASTSSAAGFKMLTAEYQAGSPRYREFWNAVSDVKVLRISADPDALQVTYTYRYRLRGSGTRTETVTLNLAQSGDELLIASAQTR